MNPAADFISLFFPRCCLACSGMLVKGEDILCTGCIRDLPKQGNGTFQSMMKERLAGRLEICYALAFLKFRKVGIVQHLLHQLKYNNHPEIGVVLGKIFGYELDRIGLSTAFDLILPVPLHPARERQRGYNQSAKFAQGISFSLKVPFDDTILFRVAKTRTQTRKSRLERWENVKGVFALSRSELQGKRILLVDDIMTTGATLEACGEQLIARGCHELSVACIAETA
jgi:ComF family protein